MANDTLQTETGAETERIGAIENLAARFCEDNPARAEAIQVKAAEAVAGGLTPKAAEIAMLRASRPLWTAPLRGGGGASEQEVILAGCLRLVGRPDLAEKVGPVAAEESRRFKHSMDLGIACLKADRRDVPSGDHQIAMAAFSTNSMTTALTESGNRIALAELAAAPPTIQLIAKGQDVRDFKSIKVLSPVLKHGYAPLAPGGEIQHAALDEELKDSAKADTYAQMFTITHQDQINDDLGVLDGMVVGLARNGARKLNDVSWALLMANATSYFAANHGNLITGVTTLLGIGGLTQGIKAFREQTDADGRPLDISPRILSVPPALEATGLQLLASTELARYTTAGTDNMPTANPWQGKLSLLVEPRLGLASYAGSSDTAWYLWADPSQSAILISYVGGMRAPTIEQVDAGPNVLGLTFRGFWDFGVSMCEWRAALKSDGA